jgi:diaminopimelate epimerase
MAELFRVSGAGNDFLAMVEPAAAPAPSTIRAWCRRGVSLGADGVFALQRRDADRHGEAVVAMDYWNADGGAAALCVNATRCAGQLAFHLGWADRRVTVATGAGPFAARQLSDREVELEMAPAERAPEAVTLAVDGHELAGWFVVVGVPHAVIPWDGDLAGCPIARLGPPLRRHERFGAAGANANFVRFLDPHTLDIRTWERGVEGETLACGSGVLAAVAAGVNDGALELPVRARTQGGFVLAVGGEVEGGAVTRWTMAGDARILACLETFAGAEQVPGEPVWA